MAAEMHIPLDTHEPPPPSVPAIHPRGSRPPVPVMAPRATGTTLVRPAHGTRPATPVEAPRAVAPAEIAVPTAPARAPDVAGRVIEDLDGNAVRSVDRAAALLIALGGFAGEAGVTELARRLGLHKSTASRLLATLQRRGLVEQDDETGKYRLGLVVIRLAERAEQTLDLRGIAMSELERLARDTRETVSLAVLDRDACLTVAQVDGPNMVACPDWTGRSTGLHCVAAGKVLLSVFAERDVLRLVKQGLEARTDRTITRLEPLLEELSRVRRRDYATTFAEWEPGVNGVAVPVRDARGRVVAAVTVWGPAYRIAPARVPDLVACARTTAAAISARLGGEPA